MYEYSENILVQESSAKLLKNELGWEVELGYDKEILGANGSFGRSSYKEILLKKYLKIALKKLNTWINDEQIKEVIFKLESVLSSSSPLQINEEKYLLLRDGVSVNVKAQNGQIQSKKALIIDFINVENNHFLAIKELKIHGEIYRRRTDIVGFVNGIPLLFIELKRSDVDVKNAFLDNYTDYQDTVPQLFYYNAFVMLSNGFEAKIGTLGSKYEFFAEWKRLNENDAGRVDLETMLKGVCKKENLLDLFENFILYDHSDGHTAKILARNHQYLGVNEAVNAYKDRKLRNGKLGVFWHTQGSGKSYSMLFFAQKVRRKVAGTPTFVVLTDREELNTQISDTFASCGLLGGNKASKYIASSGNDLIVKLGGNSSFIFTLIQKFNKQYKKALEVDHDIIIISDEAHRSQYGIFADNMMRLLPNASRIGFTGTPLLSNDNITERTFGGYISIYDFKRAVEDGATVPLYYENRGEKILKLENPEITEEILEAIDRAELDDDQQEKLEREFAKEIHILTAENRLRDVARDFVGHYSDLWTSGKAMFVCINKITCVKMYNYAQEYWQEEIKALQKQIKSASQQESEELNRKLKWMKETQMAVVISGEQNEIKTFDKWGLDIKPHREKMEKEKLDKRFKDKDDPFRVVFVCAMWLTGFDVKSLSCLYLDKPLKAHTLMQTIARANRVSEGKSNGLIIDYIGIVKALRKALASYTVDRENTSNNDPTIDKEKLINRILEDIAKSYEFLSQKGFELSSLINASDFEKLGLLADACNIILENIENKKTFSTYASEISRLMKYIDRNDISSEAKKQSDAILAIYRQIQNKKKHADNTDLMIEIHKIINEHVKTDISQNSVKMDISKINFSLLAREFSSKKRENLIIKDLEEVIAQKLTMLMSKNAERIKYYERYTKIIEEYNKEQDRASIEKIFEELMKLADELDSEAKRYVKEGFSSDEELCLYDMLFRDDLSKSDIKKLKEAAVVLLDKIKERIKELDHWSDKQETKAQIDILIRDTLYDKLPEIYDENSIAQYRQRIYEHVYTNYKVVA